MKPDFPRKLPRTDIDWQGLISALGAANRALAECNGVLHAQFEVIHPLIEGNGRLGRMLVPLFLVEKNLLTWPTFYVPSFLESHRRDYYDSLRGLDGAESWNRWIRFFLNALSEQARQNSEEARGILMLRERLAKEVQHLTRSKHAVSLLDRIFRRPIFEPSSLFPDEALPTRAAVMTLLRKMREKSVLLVMREASGRGPQVLALRELVNLVEGRGVL